MTTLPDFAEHGEGSTTDPARLNGHAGAGSRREKNYVNTSIQMFSLALQLFAETFILSGLGAVFC